MKTVDSLIKEAEQAICTSKLEKVAKELLPVPEDKSTVIEKIAEVTFHNKLVIKHFGK